MKIDREYPISINLKDLRMKLRKYGLENAKLIYIWTLIQDQPKV